MLDSQSEPARFQLAGEAHTRMAMLLARIDGLDAQQIAAFVLPTGFAAGQVDNVTLSSNGLNAVLQECSSCWHNPANNNNNNNNQQM